MVIKIAINTHNMGISPYIPNILYNKYQAKSPCHHVHGDWWIIPSRGNRKIAASTGVSVPERLRTCSPPKAGEPHRLVPMTS